MHWDVTTADLATVVTHGTTVQRTPDEEVPGPVDDTDGNVFCAFDA